MAITQVISSPVSLPVPPNPATDEEQEFDDKAYPYTIAQNEFGLDMQQISGELNTFAIQANALGLEVSNNATNAANSATTATNAAAAAEISKDEAQAIVDTVSTVLPPGTLVDGPISNTTTWSSEKISKIFKQSNLKSYYYGGA